MAKRSDNSIDISIMSFPTRMIVGPGALAHLPDEVRSLGASRVLVVADPGLVSAGVVGKVEAVLEGGGIGHARYVGVSKNPKEQDVLAGVDAYHEAGAALIIGLGGGAPMDVAKTIRLKVTHPLALAEYDDTKGGSDKISADQPPMIAIPTTAGTGSEVGRASVVSLPPDGRKVVIFAPSMMPNVALCDAELTVGLPPAITAATGIDALTHAIEAYVAKGTHPFADALALSAIARVGGHLQTAVEDGKDLRARHEMMLAASLGAISFQKGLGACHALAHPLSAIADLHHGLANALMLPHVIEFNLEVATKGYARAGMALGAAPASGLEAQAQACLDEVRRLLSAIELPARLRDVGVKKAQLKAMVPQALEDASAPGNPRTLTADAARALYEAAW